MCGLVGVAGNITNRDIKFFEQALQSDEVRGVHATGITRVLQKKEGLPSVSFNKMALPMSMYKYLPVYPMMVAYNQDLSVLMGHNRHATKGASGDHKNAHPFNHGHINLMHNGSLTTHYNLTKDTFTVDSEAICKAIEVDGAGAVIPKLRGAFALVWFDKNEQTLNFVRNTERPLSLAYDTTTGTIYWASEEGMLEWLLDREPTMASSPCSYDYIRELPVGKWYKFPVLNRKVDLDSLIIEDVELYTAPTYNYNNYDNNNRHNSVNTGWQKKSNTRNNNNNKPKDIVDKSNKTHMFLPSLLKKGVSNNEVPFRHSDAAEQELSRVARSCVEVAGKDSIGIRSYIEQVESGAESIDLDERLDFISISYTPYTHHSINGKVVGMLVDKPYTEVVVHNVNQVDYKRYERDYGGNMSGYLVNIIFEDNKKALNNRRLSDSELHEPTLLIAQRSLCASASDAVVVKEGVIQEKKEKALN